MDDGIQIAAIVMVVGVLGYAACRLECAFRTWDLLMREVDKQLREQIARGRLTG